MQRWPLLLVVILIVVLAVLATLQVQWINQVTAAHKQQTRMELEHAAARFSEDSTLYLLQTFRKFERRNGPLPPVDVPYLTGVLFPDLSRRYFPEFDVAVVHDDQIVYRSERSWPRRIRDANPDGEWSLFRMRRNPERLSAEEPSVWKLLVRHHGRPLAEITASVRRRHLA